MAQQEEGWPFGLRLLNGRIEFVREGDFSGSLSITTMLTPSPTQSNYSSSDLDSQSTRSLFNDKSMSLGSLLEIPTFLTLSRRSTRVREVKPSKENKKKNNKLKPRLFFSLCSRLTTDAVNMNDVPSLGEYLVAERRAANNNYRRNHCDLSPVQESNSPFVADHVALGTSTTLDKNNGYGTPLLFSCFCL